MYQESEIFKEFKRALTRRKESEKVTEKYLSSEVRRLGGRTYKWSSPSCRAVPDRIAIFASGHLVFVEVKSEGEEPDELQKIVHQQLRALSQKVYVIDTKSGVDEFIKIENI